MRLRQPVCVFLPLWEGGIDEMRALLENEMGLGVGRCERSACYLRATVGADTRCVQWREVAAKTRRLATRHAVRRFVAHAAELVRRAFRRARPVEGAVRPSRCLFCVSAAQRVFAVPCAPQPPSLLHNDDLPQFLAALTPR